MKVKGFKDTIDWYDNNAEAYAQAVAKEPIDLINRFVSLLPKNSAVLDAGCAAGRDSKLLHERECSVTGIDISKGLLKVARDRYPHIRFVYGDMRDMPFSDNQFDGIWAHASFVHFDTIDDVKKALHECRRVLKKGGAIHLYVKEQQGREETAVVSDKLSGHDRFFRYYAEDGLKKLMKEVEFSTIDLERKSDPNRRKEITWLSVFAS